jgi:cell division protein FtsL
MRTLKFSLVVALTAVLAGPTLAIAQQRQPTHVLNATALDRIVADRISQQDADRQVIRDVLQRPDVREVAARAGLDITRAEAGVSMLQGKDLQEAADHARKVQADLTGGSTVVISTTTIIIILLVVILIIVAVH